MSVMRMTPLEDLKMCAVTPRNAVFFLDGVRRDDVVSADANSMTVEYKRKSEKFACGWEYAQKTLYGKVETFVETDDD